MVKADKIAKLCLQGSFEKAIISIIKEKVVDCNNIHKEYELEQIIIDCLEELSKVAPEITGSFNIEKSTNGFKITLYNDINSNLDFEQRSFYVDIKGIATL